MSYTLQHVLDECVSERDHNRTSGPQVRLEIYEKSWAALNRWIEGRLAKRKGADAAPLGVFSWEILDGEKTRPIFIISDSFVKHHRVRRPRIFQQPVTAPAEDINFSQLAIKYTNCLTKDMVFSGIRDIMKKIGDFIDRVYEFEIKFSFGTMYSKERKIKFEFDTSKLTQILPDTITNDVSFNEPMTSRSEDLLQQTSSIRNVPSLTLPRRDQQTSDMQRERAVYHAQYEDPAEEDYMVSPSRTQQPSTDFDEEGPGKALSPRLQEALMTLTMGDNNTSPINKKQRRLAACNAVQEQAFLKCLDNVESKSKFSDYTDAKTLKHYEALAERDRQKKEQQRMDVKDTLNALQMQMADTQERRKKEYLERKIPQKPFFLLGDSNTGGGGAVPPEGKANSANNLIKDLESQIRANRENKIKSRERRECEEREYLDHIAMEMDLKNVADRVQHLEKQQMLLTAWERDGHIRNLHRLQEHGANVVNNYISGNMSDMLPPPEQTNRGSLSKSVGYDPRKCRP